MKEKVMQGKPYAGNPHVRFDEGADVSARPVRSALLYTAEMNRMTCAWQRNNLCDRS